MTYCLLAKAHYQATNETLQHYTNDMNTSYWPYSKHKMSLILTKPTKWHVRSAKTQISLGIRPVWSESSLSAWRNLGPLATH